jgi:hypothetical protein
MASDATTRLFFDESDAAADDNARVNEFGARNDDNDVAADDADDDDPVAQVERYLARVASTR